MKTRYDIRARTRGGLSFIIPAGSPVEPVHDPKNLSPLQGKYWVKPSALPKNSIERHDATYYGVEVRAEDVEP